MVQMHDLDNRQMYMTKKQFDDHQKEAQEAEEAFLGSLSERGNEIKMLKQDLKKLK